MGVRRWAVRGLTVGVVLLALTIIGVLHQRGRALALGQAMVADAPKPVVVIVLGSGIRPNGTITLDGKLRVERAVEVLEHAPSAVLIPTGGRTRPGIPVSEAELMAGYAVQVGIDRSRIILEDKARSTLENLVLSLPLAVKQGAKPDCSDLVLVTDAIHAARATMLSRFLGCERIRVATSATSYRLKWRGLVRTILRESAAWWYNLGKVAVWSVLGLAGLTPAERLEYIH